MESCQFPSTCTVISGLLDDVDNSKLQIFELCHCCRQQVTHSQTLVPARTNEGSNLGLGDGQLGGACENGPHWAPRAPHETRCGGALLLSGRTLQGRQPLAPCGVG